MSFDYEQSIWGRGEASLAWSDPAAFRLRQALRAIARLPAGSQILEVGCGAGQFIRAIKKLHPALSCFGSDISREAITLAQGKNDGVQYAVSEPYRLPYADNALDAVLVFDVLEHVDDPIALLQDIRRVLKRGGIFYAFVPCEGDWLSLWHLFDMLNLKKGLTQKHAGHVQFFSRKQLFALFTKEHFKIIKTYYSEPLVGQLLGIISFVLMDRAARRRGLAQINNESYFTGPMNENWFFKYVKRIVNGLVYFESAVLSRVPSPNVHITAIKLLSEV